MAHSSCILDDKLYISGGNEESIDSIEVADCPNLINGSATWQILNVRYSAFNHVFSPISEYEILIMQMEDISIFDTRSNTIEKVGENPFLQTCWSSQFGMSHSNVVVALIEESSSPFATQFPSFSFCNLVVSYTKGDKEVHVIKELKSATVAGSGADFDVSVRKNVKKQPRKEYDEKSYGSKPVRVVKAPAEESEDELDMGDLFGGGDDDY